VLSEDARFSLRWSDFVLVTVCMVLGALIRLDFLYAGHFVIDSDEAIVGLMAKHILEGRPIPVFYYGQHYMGSLEALLTAVSFSFFGVTSWALQLVPLLCSLLLIPILFFLTRECAGRIAASVAALLTAIPPAGLVVWSSKARGGFIEVLLLGAIAFLVTCRWLKEDPFRTGRSATVGFLLGVGWWVNNQIIYFIIPISLFLGIHFIGGFIGKSRFKASLRPFARVVVVGVTAFCIGSSPYWLYNIEHNFPSLGMFGFASSGDTLEHLQGLLSTALPILIGSKRFWDSSAHFDTSTALYYAVYLSLLFVLLRSRFSAALRSLIGGIDKVRPIEMFLLFVVVSCAVFSVSTFGWLVQAPRYLLPVYVGLFLLCGVAVEVLFSWHTFVGGAALAGLLGLNVASSYFPKRAVPGEPVVFQGERVARDHSELIATLQQRGISKIRTNYWIGYRLAFETQEHITFFMLQEPRQIRIQEYEEGVSRSEQDLLPLVLVPAEAALVAKALTVMGYTYRDEAVGGYHLISEIRSDDAELVSVAASLLKASSNVGSIDPSLAIDECPESRWGTGQAQTVGQEFRIDLTEVMPITSLRYDFSRWAHDYPRGLQIEIEAPDGSRRVVLDSASYTALRYYSVENGEFQLIFKPTEAKAVILRQTGKHPIFDWSIAEITLFTRK
jgi:hypothetical protein